MTFNYARSKATAKRLIARHGRPASLRREGVDRDCIVVMTDFSAQERASKMIEVMAKLAIVSVEGLTIPPSKELDELILWQIDENRQKILPPAIDERLRINGLPTPFAPGGIVLYWELQVVKP